MSWRKLIPGSVRKAFWNVAGKVAPSWSRDYKAMQFWKAVYRKEGCEFKNDHFRKIMLGMAGETDDSFLANKIVADFGCGPRGSLCWVTKAEDRIGIDILADKYRLFGTDRQSMRYVKSSETHIPLESESVDVLFTVNALDHVVNLRAICREMLRIVKPGGELIGSFNLDEEPRIQEPLTLTEANLTQELLKPLSIERRVLVPMGEGKNKLEHCYKSWTGSEEQIQGPKILWIRARKPS